MADDRCLSPQGCGVYPNYVIDRTKTTRFSDAQLAAALQLIPSGSQVHLIDDARVDVTPGYVDGQNVTHFIPSAGGGKRFIHIRFCYPPGPPHNSRCVEGWTESPNLVAVEFEASQKAQAEQAKHEAFAFSDIWDTIKNVVTDDTFWLLLGTFVTAGQAGWITGILTSAQQTALQEGMKSLAAVVVPAVSCLGNTLYQEASDPKATQATAQYKRCLAVAADTNFFDAWKGQLVWRMKRAVELGGPGVAASFSKAATALANSLPYAAQVKSAYATTRGAYLSGKKVYDDIDKEKAAFLAKLEEACKTGGGTFAGVECRPDALAQAANFHLGENYFDTSDWDPATGRPLTTADFLPKTTAALRIPDLEKAFHEATKAGHSVIPRAVTLELGRMLAKAYEGRQKLIDLGVKPNPDATTIFTKIKFVRSPSSGEIVPAGSAAAAPRTGTFGDLLTAAILTSPAWFPLFVLPSLRKWRKKRS